MESIYAEHVELSDFYKMDAEMRSSCRQKDLDKFGLGIEVIEEEFGAVGAINYRKGWKTQGY
jgi:hypothetical protein